MKHNYFPLLLALLLVNSSIIKGQQIPNSGFENWTTHNLYSLSDYYDSADEGDSNIIRSAEAQNGNYSVRIETVEETNGDLKVGYFVNFDVEHFTGGVPYTQHVDSIVGYYRANIVAQDSALVLFQFKKEGEIIGGDLYKFAADKNTAQWTRFSLDTHMAAGEVPDTLMVGTASSNAIDETGMEAGSWIELDNIKFYSAGEEVTPMPNNDFENWETITYETPDGFDSSLKWDITTSPLSIERVSNTETNSYVRINTVVNEMEQDTIRGVITNGTLIDDWPPQGGTSITQVPDSITYDIKVYRVHGDAKDTGFVEFIFLSDGQLIETYHKDYSQSTTDFIHENIPVNLAQESDRILFIAFNGDTPRSYLELDNIVLHYADEPLTYVPDDNFEYYLERHNANGNEVDMGDASGLGDGIMNNYVPTHKIDVIHFLDVHNQNIEDLTGIQDFVSLENFSCFDNQLTSLNVNHLNNLYTLYCNNNQISNLEINQLTNLAILSCGNNRLSGLDISNLNNLTMLWCDNNQIDQLDLNDLTHLTHLYCYNNLLTNLDLSQLQNLKEIKCNDNQLTYLNIQNGNNENIENFDATNNPELTCIYVDDKDASYLSGWHIDPSSHFVETQEECDALLGINESLAQKIELYPNPVNDALFINLPDEIKASKIKIYNLTGNLIKEQEVNGREIPLTDMASGIYFVKIETNKGVIAKKLIKE